MARRNAKPRLFATDSLSNLAASLNGGKDKAANDAFFLNCLPRDQIEAMYRGDWLARKIVDIVPYDSIREWREWQGDRAAVAAIERTERRLGLRKAVQQAMTLGRLYGGGAIVIGTEEEDAASLAAPLDPEAVGPEGIRFLHVVSRWQLGTTAVSRDPLDPYYGEPAAYALAAPLRGELMLHPSRVVRFLGNPVPDPALAGADLWSDTVLQTLYDAVHAVALTAAGATSLMHEAKVDIVTVPGLSEHLSNAATTAQLSARFSYAAAMKSINNLLLLGDGETWARQRIDFAGLPEMVRTFLQMAAGAADIPVTRLLGQSPAGMSATGDSDTRNYYDMISARQELDLRPQLERLDDFLLRAAGVDPAAVSFAFRPLWQLTGLERAQVALQKAQATQVYAGLALWPAAVTAALVRSQLVEDGVYPGAEAVFAAGEAAASASTDATADRYDPSQPRDPEGRWTGGKPQASALARVVQNLPDDPLGSGPEHIEEELDPRRAFHRVDPLVPQSPAPSPRYEIPITRPMVPMGPSVGPPVGGVLPARSGVPASVGPGPFARNPIPAGSTKKPTTAQQKRIDADGLAFGCHQCGTKDSGLRYGRFIGDHQDPTALNTVGKPQVYFPHCFRCSLSQGGRVSAIKRRLGGEK